MSESEALRSMARRLAAQRALVRRVTMALGLGTAANPDYLVEHAGRCYAQKRLVDEAELAALREALGMDIPAPPSVWE